jgi:hypothetical protein
MNDETGRFENLSIEDIIYQVFFTFYYESNLYTLLVSFCEHLGQRIKCTRSALLLSNPAIISLKGRYVTM